MLRKTLLLITTIFLLAACNYTDFFAASEPEPHIYDYSLTTFDGDKIHFADYEGEILVINFWASWCAPCRDEAPELQAAWEYYQSQDADVVFVGIAYADNGPKSMEFIEEFDITYLNGPDVGTVISNDFGIQGVPETFIFDQNGNQAVFIYAGVTKDQLIEIVDELLAQ